MYPQFEDPLAVLAVQLLNVSFTSWVLFFICARWVALFVSFSANCRANWSCLTLMGPVQRHRRGRQQRQSAEAEAGKQPLGIWSFGHLAIWPHCIKVCFVLINYNLCGCKTYKRAHHKMIALPPVHSVPQREANWYHSRQHTQTVRRRVGERERDVCVRVYIAYSRSISLKATTLAGPIKMNSYKHQKDNDTRRSSTQIYRSEMN